MSPQDRARRVVGRLNGANSFGRHTLISVVDARVPDKAYRILALLECVCWDASAQLAFEEIAEAVNCSRRQAIRLVRLLESLGYISAGRKRNQRNGYSVVGITGVRMGGRAAAEKADEVVAVPEKRSGAICPGCVRPVKRLGKTGVCRSCADAATLAQRVEEARREIGPDATPEQLAAHLKNARLAARIRRLIQKPEPVKELIA